MKKILMIDAQLFQTGTWDRGMGKYSLELLRALAQTDFFASFEKVELVLSQKLGLANDRKKWLKTIYPNFEFQYHDLLNRHDTDNVTKCEQKNRATLNTYIDSKYTDEEVSFFIPSIFEGDLAVPVYPDVTGTKALLFYDAIPYLYADQYLNESRPYTNYFERFDVIFETDIFFTISLTTHNDLITYFGLPSERVCNIDGAPIQLQRNSVTPKRPKFIQSEEFILLPSGNDIRKNNQRAVEAFAAFNTEHKYKLLITSFFTLEVQEMLKAISDDIIFTGNVTEQEMKWLYDNAATVFFPPLYEGLGLPILEAVESQRPIACSAIPVFQEMSTKSFCYFDPYSIHSMVVALNEAIDTQPDKAGYKAIQKKYVWSRSGSMFVKGWQQLKKESVANKPLIAVMGPTPNGLSGIGKVMQLLHPSLSQYVEVEYYLENNQSGMSRVSYLSNIAKTYSVDDFTYDKYKKYDAVIYHIGNSDYHNKTHLHATRYPGYAIFHDSQLEGLMNTLKASGLMTQKRFELEDAVNEAAKNNKASYVATIANNQLGVLAHSNYTLDAIKAHARAESLGEYTKLNLPVAAPVDSYSLPSDRLTIGVAGIIHGTKGLSIVENLAASDEFADVNFKIFGYGFGTTEAERSVLQSLPNVEVITDVSDLEFNTLLGQVDLLLNYRPHYNGESSYVTVEGMRSGATVVVRDIGWFGELPEDSVVKLKDDFTIGEDLLEIIRDEKLRQSVSVAARKTIQDDFGFDTYAKKLASLAGDKVGEELLQAQIRDILLSTDSARQASKRVRKLLKESA